MTDDDLPTVPPHIIEQLKTIVSAVTDVPTERVAIVVVFGIKSDASVELYADGSFRCRGCDSIDAPIHTEKCPVPRWAQEAGWTAAHAFKRWGMSAAKRAGAMVIQEKAPSFSFAGAMYDANSHQKMADWMARQMSTAVLGDSALNYKREYMGTFESLPLRRTCAVCDENIGDVRDLASVLAADQNDLDTRVRFEVHMSCGEKLNGVRIAAKRGRLRYDQCANCRRPSAVSPCRGCTMNGVHPSYDAAANKNKFAELHDLLKSGKVVLRDDFVADLGMPLPKTVPVHNVSPPYNVWKDAIPKQATTLPAAIAQAITNAPPAVDVTRWTRVVNVLAADIVEDKSPPQRIPMTLAAVTEAIVAYATLRFVHRYDAKEAARRATEKGNSFPPKKLERFFAAYEVG